MDAISKNHQLRDASNLGCHTLCPGQWGQQGQEHVNEKVVVLINVEVRREAGSEGITNSRGLPTGLVGFLRGKYIETLLVGG